MADLSTDGFAGEFAGPFKLEKCLEEVVGFDPNQKMEVIRHEAIGIGECNGAGVLDVFVEEVTIVVSLAKEVFFGNGVVVEVVAAVGFERGEGIHRRRV